MRATVEVYENNAGGICVAVFGQNGLTNLFVVTPDGNETRMTRAFYQRLVSLNVTKWSVTHSV